MSRVSSRTRVEGLRGESYKRGEGGYKRWKGMKEEERRAATSPRLSRSDCESWRLLFNASLVNDRSEHLLLMRSKVKENAMVTCNSNMKLMLVRKRREVCSIEYNIIYVKTTTAVAIIRHSPERKAYHIHWEEHPKTWMSAPPSPSNLAFRRILRPHTRHHSRHIPLACFRLRPQSHHSFIIS